MGVKVSVIVPVYNSEKYISQTIESLLNQTLKECEFIFINDGSKDNSLNILEEYKEKDSRIIVINQENKGVSEARNRGLEIAKGEYIGFVDSDDYIKSDMYEKLYLISKENNCDITVENYESSIEGKEIISNFSIDKNKVLNVEYIKEVIYPLLICKDELNAIWNKLYKSELICENNIKFPRGMALGEDAEFNIKCISYSKRIYYTDYVGYYYREVQGSASRNIVDKDYFESSLNIYNESVEKYNLFNIDLKMIKKLKADKLINSVVNYCYFYLEKDNSLSKKSRYLYVKNMIKNSSVEEAMNILGKDIYLNKGRYEKFIIQMIKIKCTLAIYLAIQFVIYRSKG